MAQNNNFKRGILDGIPIGLGYISVAFAFGIMATGAGLSVTEATLISLFNVTSAGQLAAVPIIASHGGFIELALTQLIINLRYALMSVSLSQKSDKTVRIRDRFLISFANTDEVFAVASSKEGNVGRSYLYGLIIMPIFGWTLGTFLGAVSGNVLPAVINSALGIAIYAMLVAVVVPKAREDGSCALLVLLSIVLSCVFYFAPILRDIPSGFTIIICSVAASALFALVRPVADEEDSENV
jgi:predicted branched-subunit amino acid permease